MSAQRSKTAMTFNVLIKKEKETYLAHCLELDIATTADTFDQVEKDIIALMSAQVDYAFSHDNLDYLYRSAPPAVWEEFYACKNQQEKKYKIKSSFKAISDHSFIPPWIIARTCSSARSSRV